METSQTYSIAQISEEFDVTHRAIRFYEDKGLISPQRQGRSRIYSDQDRIRLSLILRGKRVGFSLDEISELLDIRKIEDREVQLRVTRERFQKHIETLQNQRLDIDLSIKELEKACQTIDNRLAEQERQEKADKANAERAKAELEKSQQQFATTSTGYGGQITQPLRKW